MSDQILVVVGALVVLVFGAMALRIGKGRGTMLPVRSRRLMTAREREVIAMIEATVPHCRVHAQVAMGALLECKPGLSRGERSSVRNRFDRKVIDFVLEESASGEVLALVELDDRAHSEVKDRARDEITRAAGYRTIRLLAGKRPDAAGVRAQILAELV